MSKQKEKHNFCTQHVVNMYFSGNSMNNLLSYCGLADTRMRASEKDLPVKEVRIYNFLVNNCYEFILKWQIEKKKS